MRAKATALCQVTKAFQHNNSYLSLPGPVGLYGSLYGSGGTVCVGVCLRGVQGEWALWEEAGHSHNPSLLVRVTDHYHSVYSTVTDTTVPEAAG